VNGISVKWKPEHDDEMLFCKKCQEYKPFELMSKKGSQKPYTCKTCMNIINRGRDKEERRKKDRERYERYKDEINEVRRQYLQHRRDNDPQYRAMMALHCRLYMATKNKSGNTMKLTGCTKDELYRHLESQFTEGMNWDNYGKWHIDHIRPCASFDLQNPEEQIECFNYKNLQPLWAVDNMKKGSAS